MARIFMDGFESGATKFWTLNQGAAMVANSSMAGRSGAYCGAQTLVGESSITIPSSSEIYFAAKICPHPLPSIFFANGETVLGYFPYATSGYLSFRDGGTSATIATATQSLAVNPIWTLLEIRYLPHLTNGILQIKFNGVMVVDVTSGRTAPSTLNITQIKVSCGSTVTLYIDDIIIDDANWIGSSSIQGLAVTGAGTTTQFDPSTGSNYACVDEIPLSDADYISTNTPNEIDTYACGDLTGTINSVKTVQVQAHCMQEGSPAVPKIQLITRPSSTDRVSASKNIQTFQPGMASNIWELNPDDSAAWESADVNGMEIGVKAVAS